MTSTEKMVMSQQTLAVEEQTRIGNQKLTQYLAAFIGNFIFFMIKII